MLGSLVWNKNNITFLKKGPRIPLFFNEMVGKASSGLFKMDEIPQTMFLHRIRPRGVSCLMCSCLEVHLHRASHQQAWLSLQECFGELGFPSRRSLLPGGPWVLGPLNKNYIDGLFFWWGNCKTMLVEHFFFKTIDWGKAVFYWVYFLLSKLCNRHTLWEGFWSGTWGTLKPSCGGGLGMRHCVRIRSLFQIRQGGERPGDPVCLHILVLWDH